MTLETILSSPPQRVPRFPYSLDELQKHSLDPDPCIRRPAKLSLWLHEQPEPTTHNDPATRAMIANLDNMSHASVLRCDNGIIHFETLRRNASPSRYAEIDAQIEEIKWERNYLWWRLFRVNELPKEILTNIFRYVVWSTSDPAEGIMCRLHLTWVCKYWRRMAIADNTLWSVVWIRERAPYVRSQVWLDRAGSTALDIRVNEREGEPCFDNKAIERLLNVVLPKLSQIRMFIVIIEAWQPALTILNKLQKAGDMGIPINLQRFELHRAGKWSGHTHDPQLADATPVVFCGGKATHLKYLALNGVYVDWIHSPIRNLTTLDLRRMALAVSPSLNTFRDMLIACPNLYKLALDGAGPVVDMGKAKTLKPIELSTVRVFVMGDFSLPYALYVLSQISVPNTRDLTLMNMNGEDYTPVITAMTGIFKDVRLLTLYTVDVADAPCSRKILVKWLRSMPLVQYLRIAQLKRHIFDAFLEDPSSIQSDASISSNASPSASSESPPREVLCPKLRFLEFQSVHADTIVAFGEGRKALRMPLHKIYVNRPWVPKLLKPDITRLKSLGELLIVSGANPTPEESSAVQD